MASSQNTITMKQLRTLVKRLLATLPSRSAEILQDRFGIAQDAPLTLEAIGQHYGITRERVRQIVASGLEAGSNAATQMPAFSLVEEHFLCTLKSHNGIMTTEAFFAACGARTASDEGILRLLVECGMAARFVQKKDTQSVLKPSIVQADYNFTTLGALHAATLEHLNASKELHTTEELSDALSQSLTLDDLDKALEVSAVIARNIFGHWGVITWPTVTPKNVSDRVYLVLSNTQKPLHFREIATQIDAHKLNPKNRTAHPQTVHNELIKDDRFVLVGRGIYALAEWGYQDGTVREVVQQILEKEQTPMPVDEILKNVLRVRYVKKSTVMINLNNHFHKDQHNNFSLN